MFINAIGQLLEEEGERLPTTIVKDVLIAGLEEKRWKRMYSVEEWAACAWKTPDSLFSCLEQKRVYQYYKRCALEGLEHGIRLLEASDAKLVAKAHICNGGGHGG